MTRDEFMEEAQKEIEQIFLIPKGRRLMNLVMKAWDEGKKNAEVSSIEDIVKEAIEKIYDKQETKEWLPHTIPVKTPDIHFDHQLQWSLNTDIPSACQNCSNHPSNGGSGICHCIMGNQQVEC